MTQYIACTEHASLGTSYDKYTSVLSLKSIFCAPSCMRWRLGLTVPSLKSFRHSVCPRQGWRGENVLGVVKV